MEDRGWGLVTIAILALLVILAMAQHPSDASSQDTYNLQYTYETHETNVNICGICINTRP